MTHIVVIGDRLIDVWLDGQVEKLNPEAPVPLVKLTGSRTSSGGGGNAVECLKAAGCVVSDFTRGNSIKTRVVVNGQQLLRLDQDEQWDPLEWDEGFKGDAYLLSDYGKGTLSGPLTVQNICKQAPKDIPIVADTKGDYWRFLNCTVVQTNEGSFARERGKHPPKSAEFDLALVSFTTLLRGPAVLVTLGALGGALCHRGVVTYVGADLPPVEVKDATGAGDVVAAFVTVALAEGKTIEEACELGMKAGRVSVQRHGTTTVTRSEIGWE